MFPGSTGVEVLAALGLLEWARVDAVDTLSNGIASGLVVLGLGALLATVRPVSLRRLTDRLRHEPAETAIYGFGANVGAVVALAVVALLGLGAVVIPLALAYAFFALVAATLGYLVVGRLVTARWWRIVAVAAVVAAVVHAVPGVGPVLGFVAMSLGFGMVALDHVREYDRDLQFALGRPGTLTSRAGVTVDDDRVSAFRVELAYWTGEEWDPVVRYEHEGGSDGADVRDDGLRVRRFDEAGRVDANPVVHSVAPGEALERAFEHLEVNLETFVREFEAQRGIDEGNAERVSDRPLRTSDVEAARERLGEQRETLRTYVEETMGETLPVGLDATTGR